MIEIIPYDETISSNTQIIFNYLNGKVNLFNNRVELIIDWVIREESSIVAYHILPNKIFIYPLVIARNCPDEKYFYFQILDFLVHELAHSDQVIEFKDMIDERYNLIIEYAAMSEEFRWLNENLYKAAKDLNIYTDGYVYKYIRSNIKYISSRLVLPYERRNYADHLWMLLDIVNSSCRESINTRVMIREAIDNGYTILMDLDNKKNIIVQCDGNRLSLDCLNELFSDMYIGNTMSVRGSVSWISSRVDGKVLYINFSGTPSKLMCSIRK